LHLEEIQLAKVQDVKSDVQEPTVQPEKKQTGSESIDSNCSVSRAKRKLNINLSLDSSNRPSAQAAPIQDRWQIDTQIAPVEMIKNDSILSTNLKLQTAVKETRPTHPNITVIREEESQMSSKSQIQWQ